MSATHAEWWAHCRPHASGHQLHFDSDDEGRGGVRNPSVSTVLYLSVYQQYCLYVCTRLCVCACMYALPRGSPVNEQGAYRVDVHAQVFILILPKKNVKLDGSNGSIVLCTVV